MSTTSAADEAIQAVIDAGGTLGLEHKPLIAATRLLQATRNEALDALRELYDEQNGPPLLNRADDWSRAMEHARRVLEATGA